MKEVKGPLPIAKWYNFKYLITCRNYDILAKSHKSRKSSRLYITLFPAKMILVYASRSCSSVVVVLVLQSKGLYCLHLTTKSPGKSRHFRLQVCRPPSPPPTTSPFCDDSCLKVTQKTKFFCYPLHLLDIILKYVNCKTK